MLLTTVVGGSAAAFLAFFFLGVFFFLWTFCFLAWEGPASSSNSACFLHLKGKFTCSKVNHNNLDLVHKNIPFDSLVPWWSPLTIFSNLGQFASFLKVASTSTSLTSDHLFGSIFLQTTSVPLNLWSSCSSAKQWWKHFESKFHNRPFCPIWERFNSVHIGCLEPSYWVKIINKIINFQPSIGLDPCQGMFAGLPCNLPLPAGALTVCTKDIPLLYTLL